MRSLRSISVGLLLVGLVHGGVILAVDREAHAKEIAAWRAKRLERLRSETGWLSLVGLHWLEPGENTFGADPSNRIVLPAGSAPPFVGSFHLETNRVRAVARPDSGLTLNGTPVGEREIRSDDSETPDELRLGSLRLYVIKRGERYGIRVKDPNAPTRTGFRGLEYFPSDPGHRIEAEFVPYETPKEVAIPTVLGTVERMKAPGYVKFSLHGRELTLEPVLEDPSAKELFFIFKDETSGKETYPAGRFLYTSLPKAGRVTLDFDRAYNPPCAFTPYATCPLPPKQNRLPVRIEAGEKNYGEH